LETQHRRGDIDLRYVDQSGFCLTPYVPCLAGNRRSDRSSLIWRRKTAECRRILESRERLASLYLRRQRG
jgi:hypothetical protein